jgi:2-methylcitrate dehydratase PrpD
MPLTNLQENTMTENVPPATALLGMSVADFSMRSLPVEVMQKAACCLLDALGLSEIARNENTARAIRSITTPVSVDTIGASVWASGMRASLSEAVTANAIAVHAHFHDDSDPSSWCHPGSLILPVAVGAVEATGGDLSTTLRAIVTGYATLNWLGDQENVAHAMIVRGVRTSPTLGTVGAAAAASVALGLDEAQCMNAVAMACSITGGVLAPLRNGSDEWRVQNAQAARGGLLAAQLAREGVLGAATALEGEKGLLRTMAGLTEIPASWSRPLRPEAILDCYAKPWATLGDNMAAVRAAKLLYEQGLDTTRIESITVHLWRAYTEYPGTSFRGPFVAPVQALASTAFAVAAMLVRGDLEFDVSLDHREDTDILSLVQRIRIVPSDKGTKLDSSIEISMSDGTIRVGLASNAPRTWLYHDRATSSAIFRRRYTGSRIGADGADKVAAMVFDAAADGTPLPIHEVLAALR